MKQGKITREMFLDKNKIDSDFPELDMIQTK